MEAAILKDISRALGCSCPPLQYWRDLWPPNPSLVIMDTS